MSDRLFTLQFSLPELEIVQVALGCLDYDRATKNGCAPVEVLKLYKEVKGVLEANVC